MNLWNKLVGNWLQCPDIKGKAVRGSLALSIGAIFQRVLRLGRTVVLARLLMPEDFGVVAIIMMVVVMLESTTDAGVRVSIIQNKEGGSPSYLNVAWWFSSVRGLCLFIVAVVFAPLVSSFYNNPILTDLLRISFLSILFNGLVSPRVYLLEREFRFGKLTLLSQLSALIGTVITIVIAYYLRNVWAIVLGTVLERIIYCLLSFILFPFCPKFEVEKQCITDLFKFGRGIFGISAMNLIMRQADVFVLGRIVTQALLGSYYLALQLAEQLGSLFSSVILPVLLPSFSSMQGNKALLKSTLLSINRGIATLSIPIVVFMAVNSHEILSILYSSQYSNAGLALSILSLTMFIRVQTVMLSHLYFGLGLPHLLRRQSLKRTVFIVILVYPVAQFAGLSGAAIVLFLANVLMLIFQLYNLKSILYLKPIDYLAKWLLGIGLGMLVLIPKSFFLIFKIDSLIVQSILAMGTMIIIIIFGFNKTFNQVKS